MSRLTHIVCYLALTVGLAQKTEPNSHIILNSRGQVSHSDSRLEPEQDFAESHHHHPGSHHHAHHHKNHHGGRVYAQAVNGSTPTGIITMGSPPKQLLMIFDTGSDKLVAKTWDTVSDELDSIDPGVHGEVEATSKLYNHDVSTTYHRRFVSDPTTKKLVPEKRMISYGSGQAITDEGNDNVQVGHFNLRNFSISEITQDSIALLHTKKGISGVLGLQHMKNRTLGSSLFSSFRDQGDIHAFGYCRGTGENGTFLWGDDSSEGEEIKVIGQMHWAVTLGSVKVDGHGADLKAHPTPDHETKIVVRQEGFADDDEEKDVAADDADAPPADMGPFCPDGKCTGILDTGSNIIAGPSAAMKAIAMQINVENDCSNYHKLPTISMVFGGKNVTVHPEGYVMKVPMPKWAKMGAGGPMGGGGPPGFDESQDGAKGDDASDDGVDGDGDGVAAIQQRQKAKSGWPAVLEHLKANRGIDLTHTIGDWSLFENSTQPEFLCMPALVPLDKHTFNGPLFIVGTPLLQTHYARWSWKKGEESPKIFLKRLNESTTCMDVANVAKPTFLEDGAPVGAPLLRSEQKPASKPEIMPSRGPMIRDIEDISFPHWAKRIEHV